MGGGSFGDHDGEISAKIIGAIVGTTLAVGTAITILCSPSDPKNGKGLGTGQTRVRGQRNCGTSSSDVELMTTFKESVPCVSISKKMAKCLEGNGYDITKCAIYFDLLKEAETPVIKEAKNSVMKEGEKSKKKEAEKH